MAAMDWLARQLAWEQRLVELRRGDRPAQIRVLEDHKETDDKAKDRKAKDRKANVARKAA